MVRSSRGWSHYWNDPLLKCGSGLRVYGKQGAGFARRGLDVGSRGEVEVEGAFGGFVEFV
ncbi:hypothetical protein PS838_06098 [Pseudomonas fluorescens]|jgi:hypothetical protein|nr:hypothetical protein PS838_06098 [Pseudomonas fluorescens]